MPKEIDLKQANSSLRELNSPILLHNGQIAYKMTKCIQSTVLFMSLIGLIPFSFCNA